MWRVRLGVEVCSFFVHAVVLSYVFKSASVYGAVLSNVFHILIISVYCTLHSSLSVSCYGVGLCQGYIVLNGNHAPKVKGSVLPFCFFWAKKKRRKMSAVTVIFCMSHHI